MYEVEGPGRQAGPPGVGRDHLDYGIRIAYQVLGHGERDIVLVPGLMSHLELLWEDPQMAGFYRRLAGLGRLIMFDKRDTGLSDRASGDMPLEERMEDVRAVMRAAGSGQVVLFGYSEGGPRGRRRTARRDRGLHGRSSWPAEASRVLATIVRACGVAAPSEAAGRLVRRHRGRMIRAGPDDLLATFDAPGQAIRCAVAVRHEAADRQVRVGLHTGEIDLARDGIAGASVRIAEDIAALAQPGEILVSRTVRDLVTGSGIGLAPHSQHKLGDGDDEWPLFAVTG